MVWQTFIFQLWRTWFQTTRWLYSS